MLPPATGFRTVPGLFGRLFGVHTLPEPQLVLIMSPQRECPVAS